MRVKISHLGRGIALVAFTVHCVMANTLPVLRKALGEFETGAIQPAVSAADYAIGSHKEVSRFQIRPEVWEQYSSSRAFHDPDVAWTVASRILAEREAAFRKATGREWDAVDIYLMWNAPGQYRRVNWDRTKVSRVVLARAQRFGNLFQERSRALVTETGD